MALQEQSISFKFSGGVETKMDPKAVPGVRLLALENGVFTKAISIKKRNGYTAQSRKIDGSTALVSGAKRLGARDDELLQFTSARCYSKQSDVDQWVDAGAVVCAVGSDRPAVNTGTQQTAPDHATNAGVTAYAWEDSLGGVWWTVVDAASGSVYRAPTQAHAGGTRPRCVAVGNVIHVYYVVAASHQMYVLIVNPSSPSASVLPVLLLDDIDSTNPAYDVVPTLRAGSPALMVWHEESTTNVRLAYITAGGQVGSPANGQPSAFTLAAALTPGTPVAVAHKHVDGGNGDYTLVAFSTGNPASDGMVYTLHGGTTTTSVSIASAAIAYASPTTVKRIALAEDAGVAWSAWEENASEPSERYCVVNNTVVNGSPGAERTIRSVGLAARAFHAGASGDIFAVFVHDTTYFNTYVTLRLSDFAPVGRHMPAEAFGAPSRTQLSSVYVADDVARVVLPYKTRLQSANNDKFAAAALRLVELDFDTDASHQTAQYGAGLYMAAACPQHYDGRLWTEQGFHFGPEHITTAKAGGGSLTASSTYEYVAWYEWTDYQGEIHRGPTMNLSVDTGVGETQVTLTLPMLRVTRKSNVRICVGRSLPGDASRVWRVSSLDPTTSGSVNGYVGNDTTIDSIAFIDRMSDTDLQKQEPVYTTGGILSNDPTALGSIVAAGKNRLFFTDAQASNIVRFSQRRAFGFGLEIAPELKVDVDPKGGAVTALAVRDGIVFAFKRSSIFAFTGDGPYENGSTTNGGPVVVGFSGSEELHSPVGCVNPASIVATTAGIMFQASDNNGIWLLTPDRNVVYIGAPVETYNTQTIRRATLLPGRTAVLFLTDSGMSLYYDFLFGQWSTFTNHEGLDAVVVDGRYYYLRTNDTVWLETPGEHSDNGSRIRLMLETAWLHLQDHLQGFTRFWKLLLLGTHVSPHQLGISERLSYDEAWSEPQWLDATGDTDSTGWLTGDTCNPIGEEPIGGSAYGDGVYGEGPYGGEAPGVYQWRYGLNEDGESIQFRFEDFEKYGLAGASFELTEMTIVGGIKKTDYRPFSGARSV